MLTTCSSNEKQSQLPHGAKRWPTNTHARIPTHQHTPTQRIPDVEQQIARWSLLSKVIFKQGNISNYTWSRGRGRPPDFPSRCTGSAGDVWHYLYYTVHFVPFGPSARLLGGSWLREELVGVNKKLKDISTNLAYHWVRSAVQTLRLLPENSL